MQLQYLANNQSCTSLSISDLEHLSTISLVHYVVIWQFSGLKWCPFLEICVNTQLIPIHQSPSLMITINYYTKLNYLTKICVSQKYHTCSINILLQVIIVLIDYFIIVSTLKCNIFCGEKVLRVDEVHSWRASNFLENFCNSPNFIVLEITVGHWPFFKQFQHLAD